jgi:hypothetical protein
MPLRHWFGCLKNFVIVRLFVIGINLCLTLPMLSSLPPQKLCQAPVVALGMNQTGSEQLKIYSFLMLLGICFVQSSHCYVLGDKVDS